MLAERWEINETNTSSALPYYLEKVFLCGTGKGSLDIIQWFPELRKWSYRSRREEKSLEIQK
jgi:hypothetical protein